MKKYQKPVIISQKSFETSALSCLKTPGATGHLGPGSTYFSGSYYGAYGYYVHIPEGWDSEGYPCDFMSNVS